MSSISSVDYENINIPFCKEITEKLREKIKDLIKNNNEDKIDNSLLNLILENISDEIKMKNIRLFYHFFSNLFSVSYPLIKGKLINLYLDLIDYSLKGEINKILSNDIQLIDISLLKFIYSPQKYIKEKILLEYGAIAKNIIRNKYENLNNRLDNIIGQIPQNLEKMMTNITEIEKNNKEIECDKEILNLKNIINKYNIAYDKLKLIDKSLIDYENQIHPLNIKDLNIYRECISKHMELLEKGEKLYIWIIPFKNENKNIIIHYQDYKLVQGDNSINNLYFKNNIDEESKKKFSVISSETQKQLNVEQYIFFDKIKKEVFKYIFNINDETLNKIKEHFKKIIETKKVIFNGKTFEEVSLKINNIKSRLNQLKNIIISLNQGKFENLNFEHIYSEYNYSVKELIKLLDIKNIKINGSECFDLDKGLIEELKNGILFILNEITPIYQDYKNIFKFFDYLPIIQFDKFFDLHFDMPLIPEIKPHTINYNNFNTDSQSLLLMPIIYKKDGILKCNYNKISIQKGPLYPEFYSDPITIYFISLVDEEIIAEIKALNDKDKNVEEKINDVIVGDMNSDGRDEEKILLKNIPIIDRKDENSYKYMKVKNIIKPKEMIPIELYFSNIINKDKIENQRIKRLLNLKAGESNFDIELDIKLLTLPIEILLSCENYQLQYIKGNYVLKTNQLYTTEKLIFHIDNYISGEKNQIKARIVSLEGNKSKKPYIKVERNILIVDFDYSNNDKPKRINCKIECYLTENYKISIIIDSVIYQ